MKAIWKYNLNVGYTEIEIPAGATFLAVQEQQGVPRVWDMRFHRSAIRSSPQWVAKNSILGRRLLPRATVSG